VKANTAKFNAAELITNRVELKTKIATDLKDKLKPYGVDVVEVSITDLDFSDEFDAAIEAKVVAEQKLQKERIDLETTKVNVQKLVAQTNASATALIIQAEADAQAKIIRSEAEAEAIEKITQSLTEPYVSYYYVSQWDGMLPKVMGGNDVIIDLEDIEGDDSYWAPVNTTN
jgi:regulator of protease activity HflC (stomatin/prohibitin superfamily)